MAFEDLRIDRPVTSTPPPPRPPRRSAARWVAAVIAGIVAGTALIFWWMSRAQPGTAPPAPTTATDVPVTSGRPRPQPISLPALDGSDQLLRTLVSTLSQNPTLARLLATDGVVRAATLAVVQIGDGRTPADPLKALQPASHAAITGAASGPIDPASYARWDAAAGALTSVSPTDAAQLYVNVKPLFDEAYIDLGHPGGNFDTAIARAIELLAATPDPPADTTLVRRSNYVDYSDESLRALTPVQKQFLLVGPDHRRAVLDWLRQFAAALDLPLN
jgi:hypothetical protein